MSKQPAFTKLSKSTPFVLVDAEMSSIFKTLAKANATIDKTRTIEIQTSNLNYTALSMPIAKKWCHDNRNNDTQHIMIVMLILLAQKIVL